MIFEQYVLGCLSQLSYLVGDETTGRAVVVDPHRDVSVYLADAEEHDLRIERVTGDALFIGDVGRPDLLASAGTTPAELAAALYRSLREKLLTLPDRTRVFPAHGAGSACGKNLSTKTSSTIGEQRATNYALAPMSEQAFVATITEGQPLAPPYFAFDAHRNREQRPLLDEHRAPASLRLEELQALRSEGVMVLDAREPVEFADGHLRGSVNVGLAGRFAEYAGDVLRPDQAIVLVCPSGAELEAKVRLGRIGFDHVVGALADPVEVLLDHPELVERSSRLSLNPPVVMVTAGS